MKIKGNTKMETPKNNQNNKTEKILQELIQQQQRVSTDISKLFQVISTGFKQSDKKIKEMGNLLSEEIKGTELLVKQILNDSSLKTDNYFSAINKSERNWETLIDSIISNDMADQFKRINIDICGSTVKAISKRLGETFEMGMMLIGEQSIIPVELSLTLDIEAIDDHIENHLIPFKKYFPEHKNKAIYGAVAYIHVEENAEQYASQKGMLLLTFNDENRLVIKNSPDFKPLEW